MDFKFFDVALSWCLVALAGGTALIFVSLAGLIVTEIVRRWPRR